MVKNKGKFPNYLMNTPDNKEPEKGGLQKQPSSFVASGMHSVTPSVPFLREHKNSFQRHQKENPDMQIRKELASQERIRQREERREKTKQSYAYYKSRRPFRASELPSIWNANSREEKRGIDYGEIKEQLYVAPDDLILIDLYPPRETEKRPATVNKRTNKALHRSLGLIMEQEQARTWTQRQVVQKPSVTNGVKSFFDEMNEN
ncbi:hypothetical protein [Jeotgalibaca sp. A122]|uniref:hypothetical protein n=1 Tax=Jeotgalibaca sp. A122 TaxID=3457322 RepID=UPI003FD1B77B